MSDIVIDIEGLSKLYYLQGRKPARSLRQYARALLGGRASSMQMSEAREVELDHAFWALDDINLKVKRGEVLGVIGRNGAGKSTLLKILSRITAPTAGQIVVNGRMASLLEVGTGFHDELSGRENIYLNATILGMQREEIERKFDDIVSFSGIGRFLDSPVKHYSSGMRVRLGFSVAAHVEPDILIIDEVLSVGDLAFQEKCLAKVDSLTQELGRTVIFVSHSMSAVVNLCPRSIRLEAGRLVDDGPSAAVIDRYHSAAQHDVGRPENLRDRKDRTGSGVVRFVRFGIEDQDGRPASFVASGGPARFVLDYECEPNFAGAADLLVNIVFSNTKGMRLFGVPSDASRQTDGILGRCGRFVCDIPNMQLLPGSYDVDIACVRNRELADKIMQAATVTVGEGDPLGTGALPHSHFGDFVVPFSWDFEPELAEDTDRLAERG